MEWHGRLGLARRDGAVTGVMWYGRLGAAWLGRSWLPRGRYGLAMSCCAWYGMTGAVRVAGTGKVWSG